MCDVHGRQRRRRSGVWFSPLRLVCPSFVFVDVSCPRGRDASTAWWTARGRRITVLQGPAAAQAQGYAESHRKAYCENYTLLRDAKSTRYAHYTIPGGSNCAVSSRPGRQLATQLIMHARYMANYGAMR